MFKTRKISQFIQNETFITTIFTDMNYTLCDDGNCFSVIVSRDTLASNAIKDTKAVKNVTIYDFNKIKQNKLFGKLDTE